MLNRSAAACDTTGLKISTVKTDVLYVSRSTNHCFLQLNEVKQKQVCKVKYLGVAFTSDGRQDEELDIQIGNAIARKKTLHYSVVVRRELSKISKALNFRNNLCSFSPTVSLYNHQNLVMTEAVR